MSHGCMSLATVGHTHHSAFLADLHILLSVAECALLALKLLGY